MPIYIYKHPNKENIEVVQSMNEDHIYFTADWNGKENGLTH